MKKFLFIIFSIFIVSICTINVHGYVPVPSDGVEINDINSAHPKSDIFGEYNLQSKNLTSSDPFTDSYVLIYEAKKDAAIAYIDLTEVNDLNACNVDNTFVTLTKKKVENITSTYEEIIFDSRTCNFDVSVEGKIGKKIFGVSAKLGVEVQDDIQKYTRKFTTVTVHNEDTSTTQYGITERGYYKLQKRRAYDVFYIVYVTEVYETITKRGQIIRVSNNPSKVYKLNEGVVYVSRNVEFQGLYKFNYINGGLVLDTSNLSHITDLVYI